MNPIERAEENVNIHFRTNQFKLTSNDLKDQIRSKEWIGIEIEINLLDKETSIKSVKRIIMRKALVDQDLHIEYKIRTALIKAVENRRSSYLESISEELNQINPIDIEGYETEYQRSRDKTKLLKIIVNTVLESIEIVIDKGEVDGTHSLVTGVIEFTHHCNENETWNKTTQLPLNLIWSDSNKDVATILKVIQEYIFQIRMSNEDMRETELMKELADGNGCAV